LALYIYVSYRYDAVFRFFAFRFSEFESCGSTNKFLTSALKRNLFCLLMKYIQYKDTKDVAANGKVFQLLPCS